MIDYTAFSHGQIKSKIWLCEELEKLLPNPAYVAILGGWYGLISFLLFIRGNNIQKIRSFDIDPKVENIADLINNTWVCNNWMFKAITADANDIDLNEFNVIINTSAEHILDKKWFEKIHDQLIVIQSTDQIHDDSEEHDYCFSIDQLKQKYKMINFYEGERFFSYPDKTFSRYMLIGRKFGH
jgi:hypothetical protein